MADYTLSSGSICEPYRSPWGAFPIRQMECSTGVSSAAIFMGGRVTLDDGGSTTTHRVKRSTAIDAPYIVGIAAQTLRGSTVVTGTKLPVWEANPMVEFKAATIGATLNSSHVGQARKLMWDSTLNIEVVDLTASTQADHRVVVTGLIDQVGDSGGYVSFRFIQRTYSSVNSTVAFLAFYGA